MEPQPCPHAGPTGGLVQYLSTEVAGNALELHSLANADCAGVHSWVCGDHFHIGHDTRAGDTACRAAAAAALEARYERRQPSSRRPRGRR